MFVDIIILTTGAKKVLVSQLTCVSLFRLWKTGHINKHMMQRSEGDDASLFLSIIVYAFA